MPRSKKAKSQKPSKSSSARTGLASIGIGAHVSIAGGFCQAVERAHESGLDAFQIFTSSPRSRVRRVVSSQEEREFVAACDLRAIRNVYIHTPYYVNAASPDSRTWHFSKSFIVREIAQMDRIKAGYFVMHVGSHLGAGHEIGQQKVVRMLREVIQETPTSKVVVCLENTAGQGNEVGSDLKHLGEILSEFKKNKRVGCVIDTCHTFAAGYDLRAPASVEKTFDLIERLIGWSRIPMLHFNDSKEGLGGRRDRHEHLGKGKIGLVGLEAALRSPYLRGKDIILETEPEGRPADLAWLRKVLRT